VGVPIVGIIRLDIVNFVELKLKMLVLNPVNYVRTDIGGRRPLIMSCVEIPVASKIFIMQLS
jgi:hypothetical protein